MQAFATLSASELRHRIKRARHEEQLGERLCCDYLLAIEESRCYLNWGYSSVRQFADAELGLTPRQANERLRVARALRSLPALSSALASGAVSFSGVREITRVATRATDMDWVNAARGASARDIERLVSSSRDGEVPERTGFGLPRALVTVSFQVTPEQLALLEAAREQLASETGKRATLASMVVCAVQERWCSEPATKNPRVGRTAIPQLVYMKCPDCSSAAVHTGEGLLPVSNHVIATVETRAAVAHGESPTMVWREEVDWIASTPSSPEIPAAERDAPAGEELRAAVLARDGHRCRVPGCDSRWYLHVHHIRWEGLFTMHHPFDYVENDGGPSRPAWSVVSPEETRAAPALPQAAI